MPTLAEFSRWEQQNLALAAVTQCATLVRDLANEGDVPQTQLAACINPLMATSPDSIDEIYPHPADLARGVGIMQEMFGNERLREHGEVVRYTLGIILLRGKLMADSEMQDTIHRRLQYLDPIPRDELPAADPDNPGFSHQERIFKQLATLYQDTISTLSYRIQVQGKIAHLKNDFTANRIRALLLAGIRSAVLWHQLGGRRWRMVVYRRRIQETAVNLRRKLITAV
ncbi:MAG: high frequency lysogenization protein HflD [Proteobacteria bacterium]|nr:high frequency lysogenization protein HflD [Pseudomonadota bacterium]MDA0927390.1 high frequency lysogenization protein HflD [Pseudomonadota bacterium]